MASWHVRSWLSQTFRKGERVLLLFSCPLTRPMSSRDFRFPHRTSLYRHRIEPHSFTAVSICHRFGGREKVHSSST